MERHPAPPESERGITRTELELVIRRAAELYTREAESADHVSETELMRIAAELGLPAHHVRQALYELPVTPTGTSRLDRWYGPPLVHGTRVVPGTPDPVLDRLEEYLATREFLQLLRRQKGRALFAPADDAISNMTRAVRRPARHWHIARSRRVAVAVRTMPDQGSHVQVEIDVAQQRRRAFSAGLAGGSLIALPFAVLAGSSAGMVMVDVAGGAPAAIAAALSGASVMAGGVAAGVAAGRARFRARVESARLELASLMDRLESGGTLDPPAAPWVRSLRARVGGVLRGFSE
jgi:hypothetical protein